MSRAESRGGARPRPRAAPGRAPGPLRSPRARRRPLGGRLSSLLRLLPTVPTQARRRPRAPSFRRAGLALALPAALALLVASALLAAATAAQAQTEVSKDWGLVPSALGAGDQFRLLFVSSTGRNGSSSTIGDYDSHVQTAAASGHADIQSHSSQFKALGCTASTDARDHTGTTYTATEKGVPIYYLNGNKVADDYEDFYDGNWDSRTPKKEDGTNASTTAGHPGDVLTGCESDGTAATGNTLGAASPKVGQPWQTGKEFDSTITVQSNSRKVYGLSGVFRVAASTDATLSALVLTNSADDSSIALNETFAPGTTSYTADVASGVDRITIVPTKNVDGAEVNYFDGSDMALEDADSDTDDFDLYLDVGETIVKVKVTAEDGLNTQTYTLVVTRPLPAVTPVSGTVIWEATLTPALSALGEHGTNNSVGYCRVTCGTAKKPPYGSLSDHDFTYGSIDYNIDSIRGGSGGGITEYNLHLVFSRKMPSQHLENLQLQIGTAIFDLDGNRSNADVNGFKWFGGNDPAVMAAGTAVTVKLVEDVTVSSDATLDSLRLLYGDDNEDSVLLDPRFVPGTTSYAGYVDLALDEITFVAEANHPGAEPVILDAEGMELTDADTEADDFQVALQEGLNTIKVKVTAEDDVTTMTYTVEVGRGWHAPPPTDPVLVSTLAQGGDAGTLQVQRGVAQKFTVGPDRDYTLTSVSIVMRPNDGGDDPGVEIREVGLGGNPDAGLPLYRMSAPASLQAREVLLAYTFTAPADAVLESGKSYFVSLSGVGNVANAPRIGTTSSDAEDSGGASGWSVADSAVAQYTAGTWSEPSDSGTMLMRLNGMEVPASTDATLSALALADDDGDTVALNPTFDPATASYTAVVANDVDEVTLTATKNDDAATVVITDDDDTGTPG